MTSSINRKEWLKFGNNFCPKLFMHYHLDVKKQMTACCISPDNIDKTLDFNSIEYKKLRDDMLQGKKITNCKPCYDLEETKQTSFRQRSITDLKNFEHLLDEQIKKHIAGESLKPYWYDLRISNNCNLECIMCNSDQSSSIAKSLGVNNSHLSYEADVDINPQSIKIYLAGGEPFLIKKFAELLTKVENSDCDITVNTNATTITQSMVNALKKFKNVSLTLSLDGYSSINEKIRKNSRWSDINKNIDKFAELGYYLRVNTVIQKDNINHLYDLGTYIESKNIKDWTLDEVQYAPHLDWRNQAIYEENINKLFSLKIVKNNVHSQSLLRNILKFIREEK